MQSVSIFPWLLHPLNSLLNFQIVQVHCLLCNFRLAELLALSVHLLLRSSFKLICSKLSQNTLPVTKGRWLLCVWVCLLLVCTKCPDWTSKQQSAGLGTAPGKHATCWCYLKVNSFHEQTLLSSCMSPANFQSAELVVFEGFDQAL